MLLSVFLFPSCLKEEIPFRYTIQVKIMDKKEPEKAIKGANVFLYSVVGSTLKPSGDQQNVNGGCEFQNLLEETGKYAVRVKCEPLYYDSPQENVILSGNKINAVTIYLEPF